MQAVWQIIVGLLIGLGLGIILLLFVLGIVLRVRSVLSLFVWLRRRKAPLMSEQDFLATFNGRATPDERNVARQLISWARSNGLAAC
jgi:hypothetical protein